MQRRGRGCKKPPAVHDPKPERQVASEREPDGRDMSAIRKHYEVLGKSKIALLIHVTSQHSVLDALYGDQGGPLPSWTFQVTPEVGVSDQQHTGRCWIFATLAVMGHVFRAEHGISNHRASFSEGYIGFWDLYEKSRLFLNIALETRCLPLNDPSLSDLLRNGISDGGDYIFCLNLLDKYGIVPTEYYPNSSYGSMSTEALVTLLNQVLRDDAITLRRTGDAKLIEPMLTNVFSLLSFSLGLPPMPWKKLNWELDQSETIAHYAVELRPPVAGAGAMNAAAAQTSAMAAQPAPLPQSLVDDTMPAPQRSAADVPTTRSLPDDMFRPSRPPAPGWSDGSLSRPTYSVTVPSARDAPSAPSDSAAIADLIATLQEPTGDSPPASPVGSDMSSATAVQSLSPRAMAAEIVDVIPSSAVVVDEEGVDESGFEIRGAVPPKRVVDIQGRQSSPAGACINAKKCARDPPGGFSRFIKKITPDGCKGGGSVPAEGSGSFFSEAMGDEGGCLRGRRVPCDSGNVCRLAARLPNPPPQCVESEEPQNEDSLLFDYTPVDFYRKFMMSVKFVPVVCDARFPPGTRLISNDANMYGGLPSLYLNVTIDDIQEYAIASLKRNIPVWFACDVKKQLSPESGRMCIDTDRLAGILPEKHETGTKLEEIRHFNAIANHALLITAVSLKSKDRIPTAWRVVNSWGDVGRNAGVFVASHEWFREHVYSINVVYDTLSRAHKSDVDMRQARPTVRLGPFDPSVI